MTDIRKRDVFWHVLQAAMVLAAFVLLVVLLGDSRKAGEDREKIKDTVTKALHHHEAILKKQDEIIAEVRLTRLKVVGETRAEAGESR